MSSPTPSDEAEVLLNAYEDDQRASRRFIIGIDLGTTNCAVCFVDTSVLPWQVQTFPIPQVVAVGEVESVETLPSFHYSLQSRERDDRSLTLPWQQHPSEYQVGTFARDHGRSAAGGGRMIESAKSWLCHSGVDRRGALLPWHGAEDVERISPVEVSARYLRHIREAWAEAYPDHPMPEQDIVLTIPASFDEVARELTVAAARSAGLPGIVLIEEPQAAFYSWVNAHRDSWEQQVCAGQKILVCDIGGGTSDFSLIHVRSNADGCIQFHRVAVGEHLLLGGDNLDLALAHYVEQLLLRQRKIPGERLEPRQWSLLIPACRHAKETLLAANAPETYTIVLPGTGSRLIGDSLQIDVTRVELLQLFLEGFLPESGFFDKPQRRQSGFQEFGLPYAADAGITRYLAEFLRVHAQSEMERHGEQYGSSILIQAARPDIVLFNGGFFESPILRDRLIGCLINWFREPGSDWSPVVLRNDRLDLAVAQGAAYFGMVRRGEGIRIVAGLARTYYIGVERTDGRQAALCLIAAGSEPTANAGAMEHEFEVRTAEPVEFAILVSATRLTDHPGELVDVSPEQMTLLPPIRTVLTTRRREECGSVRARISVRMTEIGTLEMWCEQLGGPRRWQLQFDVRSATETDRVSHAGTAERAGIFDQEILESAAAVIRRTFGSGSTEPIDGVARRIAGEIGINRSDWPPSLLRGVWNELMDVESSRRRSAATEARWLNLVGFCLRPGFGMAADDWRVEETWKALKGRLIHGGPACLAEWRILCRRIAGGLSAGRQTQLAAAVLPAIRQKHRQLATGRGRAADYAGSSHEAAEIWRMLGSLEHLNQATRAELGTICVDFLGRRSADSIRPALLWALGRLGGRVPVHGPLNLVLPATTIRPWIRCLTELSTDSLPEQDTQLALMQLCRRTGDRFRDIDEGLRQQVVSTLVRQTAKDSLIRLVRDGGNLESEVAALVVGESLPHGLKIL